MTPISQMEMLHRARKVEKVISARGRLSSLSSQQFARTHNLKINGQLCSYSLNQICFPVFLLLLIGVIFNIYIRELKHGTVLGSNNRMKSLTSHNNITPRAWSADLSTQHLGTHSSESAFTSGA